MLFHEFDNLYWMEQMDLLQKWKMFRCQLDVLSIQELRRLINHLTWNYSKIFVPASFLEHGLSMTWYLKFYDENEGNTFLSHYLNSQVFYLIQRCFTIYSHFHLLCSSKTRVGLKSKLAKLPNELFYKVIELFFTK